MVSEDCRVEWRVAWREEGSGIETRALVWFQVLVGR